MKNTNRLKETSASCYVDPVSAVCKNQNLHRVTKTQKNFHLLLAVMVMMSFLLNL